jgi:hypothetical protein
VSGGAELSKSFARAGEGEAAASAATSASMVFIQ